MAFFLTITERKLTFGGRQNIMTDWEFLSQSSARVFTAPTGDIGSPIGVWVLGSAVISGFAAQLIRQRATLSTEWLIEFTAMHECTVVTVLQGKVYVFNKGNVTFATIDSYPYMFYGTPDTKRYIESFTGLPRDWNVIETEYY